MPFRLKHRETVPEAVRRIVCEQIDKAIGSIRASSNGSGDESIHDVRKRFKQVRGAIRLVRAEIGEKQFQLENSAFRDAGRPLSEVRDAKVMIEAIDGLVAHYASQLTPESFKCLRALLVERHRQTHQSVVEQDQTLREVESRLREAQDRVANWHLDHRGWKAISPGLRRAYRQGQHAMKNALHDGSDEAIHEWRKRAKDLRYQLELLEPLWPELIGAMAEQANSLTNLLGEDHDLAVLTQIARNEFDEEDCPAEEREVLAGIVGQRRVDLQRKARELGQKLYGEPADRFVSRLHGYWRAWG